MGTQIAEVFLKNGILGAIAVALAAALSYVFISWNKEIKNCRERIDTKEARHQAEMSETKRIHLEELAQMKVFYTDVISKKEETIKLLYEKINSITTGYSDDLKKINIETVGVIKDNVHAMERWTERLSDER